MGFLTNRIRNDTGLTLNSPELGNLFQSVGLDIENIQSSSELNEIVYFICMKYLCETQSKMPWQHKKETLKKGKEKVVGSKMHRLLNIRPNEYYSASTFWACVELNKRHHGNAYAYIESYKGEPESLWILPSEEMEVWIDNAGMFGNTNAVWYVWNDSISGKSYTFRGEEILHFKTSMTFNGVVGMSIKEMLLTQIRSKMYAEGFLEKLYKSNMFGSKILVHYTGDINKKAEENLAEKLESFSSKTGAGKFIPLPLGMEAKMLDMKLADAQFFENNRFSSLEITAAFGLPPNIINDYSKSSYANSESQQLGIYINTLQPSFTAYEQEVSYKLLTKRQIKNGETLEIDEKALFKMDSKTQAEVLQKRVNSFMTTPNQALEELGMPHSDNPLADELIGNGNYIPLSKVGIQWDKGGK